MKDKFIEGKRFTRTDGCYDSTDYIEFNKFYIDKKQYVTENLRCDLIKPKLKFVPEDKQCKSIGEYYTQFGIKVLYNFYKDLFGIKKRKQRDIKTKLFIGLIKGMVTKFQSVSNPFDKGLLSTTLQKAINLFYKQKCKKIIPHYNKFYTFYTEKYTQEKKNRGTHVDTADCDYFKRIPLKTGT